MKSKELISSPYGLKVTNRNVVKLSDLCSGKDGIQTGPFGSQLHNSDYVADGTPIITVEHLGENVIDAVNPPRVHANDVARLSKYTLQTGDIVFSRVGSVDRRALVSSGENGWMFSGRLLRIRPNLEKVDPRYLSYFFGLTAFKSYIRSIAVGATMPSLNTDLLANIPILVPSLHEQRKIGEILSIVDSKIRLNQILSKTLEQIAQSIFKSWFIDFDPVKAKLAGEKPVGMDDTTAALFPELMKESELGLIPEGWVLTKVEDLLDRIKVKPLPKSTVVKSLGRTLVLEQGDSLVSGFVDEDATVQASVDSPRFIFGDHTCRMHLSTLPFSVFANTIALTSNFINPYWAYWATRDIQKFESYRRHWAELAFRRVLVPSQEIADRWGKLASIVHSQLDSLMLESRQLADLRDSLLPRLISGELQIPEEMLVS
jgi:type I restriction enzyme S subunit